MRLRAITWKPEAPLGARAETGHTIAMRGGLITANGGRWVIHWPRTRAA